jgi:hypothetical protein
LSLLCIKISYLDNITDIRDMIHFITKNCGNRSSFMNKLKSNLKSALLLSSAITLSSFVVNIASAKALSTVNFNIDYDILSRARFVPENNVVIDPADASSTNASFGLTSFTTINYASLPEAQVGFQTGKPFEYGTNPRDFGFNEDETGVTFFGSGDDRIFGSLKGIAVVDPQTFINNTEGSINITGGTGRFQNASGQVTFSGLVNLNPNNPVNTGKVSFNFSVTTPKSVPENNLSGITLAVVATGLFLSKKQLVRQYRNKTTIQNG